MAEFSDQTIEEIRARCDIVDIVSQRVPLKRAGSDFKACCPFHHEKTPSFIVSPSRRTFHCFGCGLKGDVFKFLMLSDGLTFPDAVRTLADRCGVRIEESNDSASRLRKRLLSLHDEIASFYQRCLAETREAQHAREYLAKRKLDNATVAKFRIGYAPSARGAIEAWAARHGFSNDEMVEGGFLSPPRSPGDSFYDKFRGRLMFPICDQNGHVVAFSGRALGDVKNAPKYYNSTETQIFRKSRVLYGLSFAKRAITRDPRRTALICEGQIDVIRCHSCGFENAVASQGTAFTESHVSLLKSYADGAIMVFDGDGAGMKAAIRTGRLFLAAGMPVQAVLLPQGDDPDSFLRDHPASDFQKLLDSPVSLVSLHLNQAQGGSIDSLAHTMDELFETFASSSKSVFRSFMIQEAATLLKMPQEAIEEDFNAYMAQRERRNAWNARGSVPASAGDKGGHEPENGHASAGRLNADPQPQSEEEDPSKHDPAPEPAPRKMRIPETPLLAIADILVKTSADHSEDSQAIASFISHWMPPADATSPVSKIIDAALSDSIHGTNMLSTLTHEGSPEERALVGFLARRPSPVFNSETSIADSVKDLVYSAWVDFIRKTKAAIDTATPDGNRRRLMLSSALLRLESATDWPSRSKIIGQFL